MLDWVTCSPNMSRDSKISLEKDEISTRKASQRSLPMISLSKRIRVVTLTVLVSNKHFTVQHLVVS